MWASGLKCNLWNCESEEYIYFGCGVSHIPAVMQTACFLVFSFFMLSGVCGMSFTISILNDLCVSSCSCRLVIVVGGC